MSNTNPSSLVDVVAHMDELVTRWQNTSTDRGFLPFMYTYRAVTKEVIRRRDVHMFKDPEQLERLDIIFANQFFRPYTEFLQVGVAPNPWRIYFEYCKNPNGDPILQMLLGINAHINGDLAVALVRADYQSQTDFMYVDMLLKKVIPQVLWYLGTKHRSFMSVVALAMPMVVSREFNETIVRWRESAWQSAMLLRADATHIDAIRTRAEEIGSTLIELFRKKYRLDTWAYRRRILHSLSR